MRCCIRNLRVFAGFSCRGESGIFQSWIFFRVECVTVDRPIDRHLFHRVHPMKRFVHLLLLAVIALAAVPSSKANLGSYGFTVGSGRATDMSSANTLWTGSSGS